MEAKSYYIYILECTNGALYTGYTTDIERRYREHQQGSAKCKYTRSFPPVKISACWKVHADISAILKVEHYIKALSRDDKKLLVERPNDLQKEFIGINIDEIIQNKECKNGR